MGNKDKETEKNKRNNGRNGMGESEIEKRTEEKSEWKEQKIEQQRKTHTKKSNMRTLTGVKKEIKKENAERPKKNILDQRRREEEKEIKRKIEGAVEAWQTYYNEGEEGTEEEERKEKEVMNEIKKHKSSRTRDNRNIYQEGARSRKRKKGRGDIYVRRLHNIRCKLGTIHRRTTRGNL